MSVHPRGSSAAEILDSLLQRLPDDRHQPLVLGAGEQLVAATSIIDRAWLAEQIRLRGQRWGTDDRRVLTTLWWYSASSWVVGPTLTSVALGHDVLSAALDDLSLHWLPDSRITGATSSRVLPGSPGIATAVATLREMYDVVVPELAGIGGIGARPLWAMAADAIASRLAFIGRAIDDLDRVTALLEPLVDAIGAPLPLPRYTGRGETLEPKRLSCCLLYLAPQQTKCSFCPRRRG
ncbi:MAG: hypothetical protein QM733_21775 [Ilumatobacteraceae bacterium]